MTNYRYAPALLLVASLVPTGRALALERAGYSMEILVGGTPLSQYAARGTNYVEALKNREYSVRLRNGTGERVAIALSVDGLNSIDARTTSASDARKWILGPYETITLDGWQTTSTTARRFLFTTEGRSYGAWLGRTQNLGLIAAAVFREKRPVGIVIQGGERREGAAGESEKAPKSAQESLSGAAYAPASRHARFQLTGLPSGIMIRDRWHRRGWTRKRGVWSACSEAAGSSGSRSASPKASRRRSARDSHTRRSKPSCGHWDFARRTWPASWGSPRARWREGRARENFRPPSPIACIASRTSP